jgi:tetratricopeptide (TPR) repeat protein
MGAMATFAIALVVRLLHIWDLRASPYFSVLMGDARGYDEWARRIAGGDWIGSEVFYQAPLYPYFLAVVYASGGDDPMTVRVVQAIVGSLACAWLAIASARLFSRRAGWIAGVGMAIYAPAVFFDALVQKSVLDVFFIGLALCVVSWIVADPVPRRHWFLLGLTLGALSLTRENGLVLLVPAFVWSLKLKWGLPLFTKLQVLEKRQAPFMKLPPAVALVAGVAVLFAPVVGRNFAVGGGLYLTTSQFGSNFYIGNNPRADGSYVALREGRGSPEYERLDATELAERATARRLTPNEVSAYWRDRALQYIVSQPADWLALMARKLLLLVSATEMIDTESQQSHADWSRPLRMLGWIANFGVLLPLAVIGVAVTWRDRRRIWILHAMTLAYAASVLIFFVVARYRYPLVPFLMLFTAAGVAGLPDFIRATPPPRLTLVTIGVLVIVSIAQWPVLPADTMRAITDNNLGAALQEQGRLDEARKAYEAAVALRPDYAPAHNNLGVALRAQGRLDEAVASYRRALTLRADYSDAHFNLANALIEAGKPSEAAEHFRQSGQAEPATAATHNNLGIALANQGRLDDAIREFRAALQLEPGSTMARRNLGDALASQGKYHEAIDHLRQAVAAKSDDPALHYDLGSVFLEAGRVSEAEQSFRDALRHAPDSAEAHNNLGIALATQGRLKEAVVEFERALKVNPSFEDAKKNLDMARKGVR